MDMNVALNILANPIRREILILLSDPKKSFRGSTQPYEFGIYGVCATLIQEKIGLLQPATSENLRVLVEVKFIVATKIRRWTYYKRNTESINSFMVALKKMLK